MDDRRTLELCQTPRPQSASARNDWSKLLYQGAGGGWSPLWLSLKPRTETVQSHLLHKETASQFPGPTIFQAFESRWPVTTVVSAAVRSWPPGWSSSPHRSGSGVSSRAGMCDSAGVPAAPGVSLVHTLGRLSVLGLRERPSSRMVMSRCMDTPALLLFHWDHPEACCTWSPVGVSCRCGWRDPPVSVAQMGLLLFCPTACFLT